MHWPRAFALGLGAAAMVAVLAGGGVFAFERLRPAPATQAPGLRPHVSSLGSEISTAGALAPGGDAERTKESLAGWQSSGVDPGSIKRQILDAAVAYFASQPNVDQGQLRGKISLLNAADYNGKSGSFCEDSKEVRPATEAWLLDIRGDALFVNDGFAPAAKQSATDLFFRYTIALYNLAPELKSYPNGVKSSDGTTAYYEKGLILLGRRVLDRLANTSCYLQYRRPVQDAYTADRALNLLNRIGLAPSRDYDYPQKGSFALWRAKIAPRLGSSAGDLLEPYLKTDSGEFYRRVGQAIGGASDSSSQETAADALFRQVFPA